MWPEVRLTHILSTCGGLPQAVLPPVPLGSLGPRAISKLIKPLASALPSLEGAVPAIRVAQGARGWRLLDWWRNRHKAQKTGTQGHTTGIRPNWGQQNSSSCQVLTPKC